MLKLLPAPIRGSVAATAVILNTISWCSLLYVFALLRMIPGLNEWASKEMIWAAESWIAGNSALVALFSDLEWDVRLPEGLHHDVSYLVIANHQSWVDIVAIQHALNKRIPFLRFFLKNELRYVPLLGLAWKALDFPFMKRYSKEYLAKHPGKRGEDLAATKRACDKLRGKPISILNFLEGTRFTHKKHAKSKSGFSHLLPPKTGGIAFVIEAMGEQFDSILDITVHYPGGAGSLWDLFCGRIPKISVWVDRVPIPQAMLGGNYFGDDSFRQKMQAWVQTIWATKDSRLKQMT
jgi:1-acyl-sn-glycerol-3-phosphate acyltransferase